MVHQYNYLFEIVSVCRSSQLIYYYMSSDRGGFKICSILFLNSIRANKPTSYLKTLNFIKLAIIIRL